MRTFNEILAERLNLSDRAAEAVRAMHEYRPFECRADMEEAYYREIAVLEAGLLTDQDRRELQQKIHIVTDLPGDGPGAENWCAEWLRNKVAALQVMRDERT